MRVKNEDTNIFMGDPTRKSRHEGVKNGEKKAGMKKGVLFAGNLTEKTDKILLKRQQAQKKAMKVLTDANAREGKIDQGIEESRAKIQELKDASDAANEEIKDLTGRMDKLKEDMGIKDDSQEQKDLELLIKQKKAMKPGSGVTLTEEEQKRLSEMGEPTEYQRQALGYADNIDAHRQEIDKNQRMIGALAGGITATNNDRVKSQDMLDAVKEAEGIQKAASKEIMGMLVDEAKDHIDEELKKKEEEAKKAAEKKKEEEEKKAEAEKKAEEAQGAKPQEEQKNLDDQAVEDIQRADGRQTDVQQELKKILDEAKLLEEDLKGIAMDEII